MQIFGELGKLGSLSSVIIINQSSKPSAEEELSPLSLQALDELVSPILSLYSFKSDVFNINLLRAHQ